MNADQRNLAINPDLILHKNPGDLPIPPDQDPQPPVQNPRTTPGRGKPAPKPIEDPRPDRPEHRV